MSTPTGEITPDKFVTTTSNTGAARTITFFIPGNPGLISYYHLFLSLLTRDLGSVDKSSFVICAHSLAGFEVGRPDSSSSEEKGKTNTPRRPYGLTEQIEFVERKLQECVQRYTVSGKDKSKPKVILVGHSVGSYITMEILRRWHERPDGKNPTMDIVGGVMLFPTVVDIAKSPSGKKLTLLLLFIPYLAVIASFVAKIFTAVLPDILLTPLVRAIMGRPHENAVNTTVAFLRSQYGVQQAIHLGANEMRDISADRWSDEVWGISSPDDHSKSAKRPPTKLQFYFGRNDHWVADQTRDNIIRARAARTSSDLSSRPKMMVCKDGISHGFCLSHNEAMAPKLAGFIRDIIEEERVS